MAEQKATGQEYYRRIKRAFGQASDGEIAERLGTSRQSVSYWKTGKAAPDGNKLIRAAQITGVRQEWFTTGEEQYFEQDDTLRPYSGPEHYRLAAAIDAEFQRVAELEGITLEELVSEVAGLLQIPERNLYNYRSGKWSAPAAIIPRLSARFKSTAVLRELLGAHVEAAIKPLLDGLESQLGD